MAENVLDQWLVEYNSGIPVYRQIINQTRTAVAAGRFKPGDQLPTIRALSERLNVNPNTVAKAYRELELMGIIVSERGSGSFIQAQPPAPAPDASEKKATLKNLYYRLLADAASSGLTESELLGFIKEKNSSIL
ncbi:MAG TPA: GntR family transcriptional regulator [Candidatus Baltobacteraceae bacterium]|jgi:GntR family transcriptional regulator|nr:GntR family transcriptional regulator [Candidatus Baltobacteraceae bacterium]